MLRCKECDVRIVTQPLAVIVFCKLCTFSRNYIAQPVGIDYPYIMATRHSSVMAPEKLNAFSFLKPIISSDSGQ